MRHEDKHEAVGDPTVVQRYHPPETFVACLAHHGVVAVQEVLVVQKSDVATHVVVGEDRVDQEAKKNHTRSNIAKGRHFKVYAAFDLDHGAEDDG